MMKIGQAKYCVGQVVRHRFFPFRGVIFDVDPNFANTEEWYQAIPEEIRPSKDQPFYHLLAENDETEYVAYVSEQNLLPDDSGRAGAPSAGSRSLRQLREGPLPQPRRPELARWRPISIVVIAGPDPAIHSTAANCDQRSRNGSHGQAAG